MRNLTVKRNKSFVASLATMKVYIEDPKSNDLTIQGFPCRKLCTLKNGEEKTVEITESAARIYVIADTLSKNYCNEFYELPAGQNDVFLSGQNHLNPGAGNPFHFDGNTGESALKNRKESRKKSLLVFCIALAVGAMIGAVVGWSLITATHSAASQSAETAAPKTFTAEGMEITLTTGFREMTLEGFTACYDSNAAAVMVLKEPFTLMEGMESFTLEQYGRLVLENNGKPEDTLHPLGERYYFDYTYTDPQSGTTFYYMSLIARSQDAFWLIQFAVPEENLEEMNEYIITWANSVTFP